MKRRIALTLATTLLLLTSPAEGQEGRQSRLLLSLFGGITTSSPLWTVNRQPVFINTSTIDTVRLVRRLQSGIMFGASGTLFPSPHFGLHGEIAFLGLGLENRCRLVFSDPAGPGPSLSPTADACDDITETDGSATTGAFFVGGVVRAAPRGFASPFLRIMAGITTRSSSTTQVAGRFIDATSGVTLLPIISDPEGGKTSPAVAAAAGVMVALGPGYQLRLELRDHILVVDRITAPADPLTLRAPAENAIEHNFALSVGLDIVLEQRRGRRY